MKVTIDLDADLYRSLKVEAARGDRSVRDVIAEALAQWLDRREDEETAHRRRRLSPNADATEAPTAAEAFAKLAAETKAEYGSER